MFIKTGDSAPITIIEVSKNNDKTAKHLLEAVKEAAKSEDNELQIKKGDKE